METAVTDDGSGPSRRGQVFDPTLPAAVLQAAEWRYLVRMLYTEAGSPPIPGYPRHLVQEILWGNANAGAGFFEAMLTTLNSSATRRSLRLFRRPPQTDTLTPSPRGVEPQIEEIMIPTRSIMVSQDGILRVRPPEAAKDAFDVFDGSAAKPATPARAKHGYSPPNPNQIESITEYVEALKLLLTWSGMNLRELEQQSKHLPDGGDGRAVWLARSTVSDMLKRTKKLPKPEMVRAFTAACGLTMPDQERWLDTRNRLEAGGARGKRANKRTLPPGKSAPTIANR